MTTPDKCARCPGQLAYDKHMEAVAVMREKIQQDGKDVLDDDVARELAAELCEYGLIESEDIGRAREAVALGMDVIDRIEELIVTRRNDETRFCIGALRMRARDERTQYDVTLCRSPNSNDGHGDIKHAVVNKKSL